ncbi:hypothetical protein TTHERM_00191900 (macronuclear) [Tetrahymena thermophila SB210]|uniref:Uncharacterized protein n=1 Tax=Tetrahymena thermophila (strain SB210) TaxID=312017 RepID=I7MEK4_TETTS|nr:hypothetical protein TTHERM_00191900 [Tetrahymena thermophila SB210]EAR96521.1 hypothetical protein TTHERM_00191900 [Tetrahymena thermophila SB210]|eukprot:XP_001016766.1 hypothetical protein TTHERM_00191900 [Tetrahymena thermophila SB210]
MKSVQNICNFPLQKLSLMKKKLWQNSQRFGNSFIVYFTICNEVFAIRCGSAEYAYIFKIKTNIQSWYILYNRGILLTIKKQNCGDNLADLKKIKTSSLLKLSVYYNERKNQIQNRQIFLAFLSKKERKQACKQVCLQAKVPILFNNLVITRINNQYIIPSHIE